MLRDCEFWILFQAALDLQVVSLLLSFLTASSTISLIQFDKKALVAMMILDSTYVSR